MRGIRRLGCLAGVFAAFAIAAPAAVMAAAGRDEYSGNPGQTTWTFRDVRTETGRGPNIPGFKPILVSCRVRGRKVADGNVWWYRIAAKPWSNQYYASADDFYNDGRTHGSLHGTPFFDPKVPVC